MKRRLATVGTGGNALFEDRRLSPLVDWIERYPLAPGVQFPTFAKYSGKMKARDHVLSFEAQISLVTTDEGLKCEAFRSTLQGLTLAWFSELPLGSVSGGEDFKVNFFNEFASSGAIPKDRGELCKVVQGHGESNASYLTRFTAMLKQVPNLTDPEITLYFQNGL